MDPIEAQRVAYGADLRDEEVDREERRVVGQIRLPAAELVVEDRPTAGGDQRFQRLEVVVRRAWAAVEEQDGELSCVLSASDDPVPRLVAVERDPALECFGGCRHGRPPA